jgi:bifunctional DNA-binding transcriptional regulator/antitoxin component of YhaV-PrlF toxin-antitoxin module
MESPNIVKVDSKGRILIPVQFRCDMGVEEGTEMIIVPDDQNNHFKILPIAKDSTAELRMMLSNMPSSLASVADALSANSFNILVSESRRMGEDLTEWRIIVDLPNRNDGVDTLRDVISSISGVKSLDVVKK